MEADPELPGTVEALPLDLFAWILVVVGAFLLARAIKASFQSWSARRPAPTHSDVDGDAVQNGLRALSDALVSMSADQKREALMLAHLARVVCGRRWGFDCTAMTDVEILQHLDARHPADYPESQGVLLPLLALSSEVLYANRIHDDETWMTEFATLQSWARASFDQESRAS
ncbi:MAG: hypothetical protein ACPG31_13565 [Planctomycetota bacterium]